MTLHDILCANEKKDQSEIGVAIGRTNHIGSAAKHADTSFLFNFRKKKEIPPHV